MEFLEDLTKNPSLINLAQYGQLDKENKYLQLLGEPHVESFNFLLKEGLEKSVANLIPQEFDLLDGDRIKITIEKATFCPPELPIVYENKKLFPSECRQRESTYKAKFLVEFSWSINGIAQESITNDMGYLPIMVKSDICNLAKLSSKELIQRREHQNEWGGYFIIGGHEKLIRMLIMTRRNYPIALCRSSWKKRGTFFSEMGVMIRCVQTDETETTNVLHFTTDGNSKFMFSYRKAIYYTSILLILKCLIDVPDSFISKCLMFKHEDDLYFKSCLTTMLREIHTEGINTHEEAKEYIGRHFRIRLENYPSWKTNTEACDYILKHCIAIHLDNNMDKFNLLVFMTQKLYSFIQNKCCYEGVDSTMMQEILLGGHLYSRILKEKLQTILEMIQRLSIKKSEITPQFKMSPAELLKIMKNTLSLERGMHNFLATGSINSPTGLGLMQTTGLVIVAENINRARYMSHFRAVHRGSFFQEMRTTEPRQLLPDAWGFICPVHTPDGTPCGLLNHLTKYCKISPSENISSATLINSCLRYGLIPLDNRNFDERACFWYDVFLDGKAIGFIPETQSLEFTNTLRKLKIDGKFPTYMEIVSVPMLESRGGQFPGIFLFTSSSRFMRPVFNIREGQIEFIGSFEQINLEIAIKKEDIIPGLTTHLEISETSFLSNLACLIPMPDCNQSPRNMYQCQMAKQTMGTPCHNYTYRSCHKLYRLQTPASPFFRPVHHDLMDMDTFPMGTNAIVAVISYTGYDMEDALIINKASYERGFASGMIYKSEFIELDLADSYFAIKPDSDLEHFLDSDGLPRPGGVIRYQEPYCCYYDYNSSQYVIKRWKNAEDAYIDSVKLCGTAFKNERIKACITYRLKRNPTIGDKFASRAGQKGICSQLWPAQDLPFSETGMMPDIIFNPHGFPSRMTIAMMIELMAGKSASINGHVYDATPFRFSEDQTAIDYFGQLLQIAGYNYYGQETMYSGISGREFKAQIYMGVVHYQRLRHMVFDKWQVRRTGPLDILTNQPVKGRRREGGIRFGEMERDALLSHGASFLLQDRLFHGSDKCTALICRNCGSMVSVITFNVPNNHSICKMCNENGQIDRIEIPYIFKYLLTQFASINIKIKLNLKSI